MPPALVSLRGLRWLKLQLKTPSDCDWEAEASGVGWG